MPSRDILISLKPLYWRAILSGEKAYEFRRRFPDMPDGVRAYVYVSSPASSVEGAIVFGPSLKGAASTLSSLPFCGPSVADYLAGASDPTALPVVSFRVFERFVTLDVLQAAIRGFVAPQSWMYATADIVKMMPKNAFSVLPS